MANNPSIYPKVGDEKHMSMSNCIQSALDILNTDNTELNDLR